jgi:UDP-N-acetylmuramyl pentapeptide synthase
MQVALNAFAANQAEKKIVILGDMLELGDHTKNEHENILNLCLKLNFKKIFTIGNNFKSISIDSNKIFRFEKIDMFIEYFKKTNILFNACFEISLILLKEATNPFINDELNPSCSISFNPVMVQPLGVVTLSISCSG